jgi:ABC-type phosphate transport system substrate-binding protein
MRVVSKFAVVAAVAASTMALGLGPALADPPSGTTPALVDVVGVGSDTTQLVMDAISSSWDGGAPAHKIYSWDAVNPVTGATGDTIETKGVGPHDPTCDIARPNGSGAGITALAGTKTDSGLPCIDYARSSRGPQTGDPTGLVWSGYGTDAVSWTVPNTLSGAPTSLTISQLQNIYLCTSGYRHWNSPLVGGTSGGTIVPALPQTSSGTRAFFLKAIGVTTPGACVVNGSINIPGDTHNPVPLEENTGVSLKDSGGNFLTGNQYQFNNFSNTIYPYSVADWIAQTPAPAGGGHKTPSSAPGILVQPQPVGGVSPIMTNGSSIDTLNPAFTATLTRTVYNVMPNAGTASAPAIPTGKLKIMFGPGGAVCSRTGIIQSYGFALLSNCGSDLVGT